jgi:hypothetical protein
MLMVRSLFFSLPTKVIFFYILSMLMVFIALSFYFRLFMLLLSLLLLVGGVYLLMVYLIGLRGNVFWAPKILFFVILFLNSVVFYLYYRFGYRDFIRFFNLFFISFFFLIFFILLFMVNFFLPEKGALRLLCPSSIRQVYSI